MLGGEGRLLASMLELRAGGPRNKQGRPCAPSQGPTSDNTYSYCTDTLFRRHQPPPLHILAELRLAAYSHDFTLTSCPPPIQRKIQCAHVLLLRRLFWPHRKQSAVYSRAQPSSRDMHFSARHSFVSALPLAWFQSTILANFTRPRTMR